MKTPQRALHDHNESKAVPALIDELLGGRNIALVSDAGTPLLSDPGYKLVAAAHKNGIAVSPIPGASAVTAALSAAGLPTDRFCFEGFPPSKQGARETWLRSLAAETRTMVFFESVHRIRESVASMTQIFGAGRQSFIGRELSKLHEQCVRGSLAELGEQLETGSIPGKGEFVVIVHGADKEEGSSIDVDLLITELASVLPGKQVAAIAAKVTGEKRNVIYARMLELTKK